MVAIAQRAICRGRSVSSSPHILAGLGTWISLKFRRRCFTRRPCGIFWPNVRIALMTIVLGGSIMFGANLVRDLKSRILKNHVQFLINTLTFTEISALMWSTAPRCRVTIFTSNTISRWYVGPTHKTLSINSAWVAFRKEWTRANPLNNWVFSILDVYDKIRIKGCIHEDV